ncbi:MAG: lipocalin-like domain-containing protein [Bryobacteraceae bacterium]
MRLYLAALFVAGTLAAQPPMELVKSHFLGVWKLVSYESKGPSGEVTKPYGDKPQGRLAYENDGHFSLQIMRPGARFRLITRTSLPAETSKEDFAEAWFGSWDIDPDSETVLHQIDDSVQPAQIGTSFSRSYNFWNNRMILTANAPGRVTRAVWQHDLN